MGIRVMRSERADVLAADLARTLSGTAADPFRAELIVVPTRGIERFLSQAIADGEGIAANLDFALPREFLGSLAPDGDPWAPQRLVWPLLAVIDATRDQAWAEPLNTHLLPSPDWDRADRRFAVAEHLAALFASYTDERPDLIAAWDHGDGTGVPEDLHWQFALWRALRVEVGSGPLDAVPDLTSAPPRISVFGPTRLPERFLRTLRALAVSRSVDLYLPIPSNRLWDAERSEPAAQRHSVPPRDVVRHPLLRTLARDARELRQRLEESGTGMPAAIDSSSLLGQLQRDVQRNTASSIGTRTADDSLQVHACHGPLRQVEVTLETILALLHEHPELQPRDIIIMTPDLATYAPLITAAFSGSDARMRDLRLTVADRTKEQGNDVLTALDALLRLLPGRCKRSEILDLLRLPAVRQRFGWSEDDAARIEELAASAEVRWGLDEQHRADYGLGDVDLGTWTWGLRRLALGAAMSEEGLATFGDVLPLPDVTGGDVRLIGALAQALGVVQELRSQVRSPRSMRAWNDLLQRAITDLTDARYVATWQTANAMGAIEGFLSAAGEQADSVDLSLGDIRHMLASVLAGRPTRAGFRQGGVTACQLEPMRSVPYKVICLIGMDDGSFPRRGVADGDNLLLRDPRIGERDPGIEDRQLFLDAIMAATEHLVITYSGRDERSNHERQPAVPLAELIDLLPGRSGAVRHHRLQPFDPADFQPHRPFGHSAANLAGARAVGQPRIPAGPLFAGDAAAPIEAEVPTPDELARFLQDPMASFLRRRIGLRARRSDADPPERVPVALDPLVNWQTGDALLSCALRQEDAAPLRRALRRAGTVPPDALGTQCLDAVEEAVAQVVARIDAVSGGSAGRAVSVALPWANQVSATIDGVHDSVLVRTTFSSRKPKQLLRIWPDLLCLKAAVPEQPWRAVFVTKKNNWYVEAPEDADKCVALLNDIVALYHRGAAAPLPFASATSHSYAKKRLAPGGTRTAALLAAQSEWEADRFPEHDAESACLTYGFRAPFAALLSEAPAPVEQWESGEEELTRFEALALRVWTPLLQQTTTRKPKAPKGPRAATGAKR